LQFSLDFVDPGDHGSESLNFPVVLRTNEFFDNKIDHLILLQGCQNVREESATVKVFVGAGAASEPAVAALGAQKSNPIVEYAETACADTTGGSTKNFVDNYEIVRNIGVSNHEKGPSAETN
jgi:hypothetical protein